MSKLIFLLILFVFVLILSATPLFRKSRSQREYESSGMQLLATSRGRVLLLPALGCLCACIVTFFMVLMYQDIGFEASDIGSLLSCIGVTILLVVVCFLGGYAMQARHVLYNEEILLIGKPFRPYQTIHWYEISEMRIKNQDFFDLYDRNGRRCVSANANLEGYRQFYQAALRFTRPEYTAKQKNTPYDNPVSAASGCGTLRYRTGEYYALLILYAVVMFLFFGLTVFSGESISGTLQIIREEKLYGALFFPVVFVGTVLALFYVSLQKITYDREKIVISRFPRRTQTLLRRDIRQLECTSGSQGLRTLTLHTDNRRYVIREKQFRVGFPEFFNELIH